MASTIGTAVPKIASNNSICFSGCSLAVCRFTFRSETLGAHVIYCTRRRDETYSATCHTEMKVPVMLLGRRMYNSTALCNIPILTYDLLQKPTIPG